MKHSLITLVAFAALAGCSSKEDPQSPTQNRSSTIRNPRGGRISFVCPMPIRSVPADGNSAPPELSGKPLTLTLTRPTTEPVNKGPQTLTLIAPGGYRKGPVSWRYNHSSFGVGEKGQFDFDPHTGSQGQPGVTVAITGQVTNGASPETTQVYFEWNTPTTYYMFNTNRCQRVADP